MKIIDYILKFSFGIALGLVIIFKISPLLFNIAEGLTNEALKEDKLLFLSLECFIPNDYSDVRLTGKLSNAKGFTNVYEVSNNSSYNHLVKLFFNHGLIGEKDLKGKLPFSLTKEQLDYLGEVKVKLNKENKNIEKLIIDDVYILGDKPSIIRIGFIYFLTGLTFILGGASLITAIIMLLVNLNIYNKTNNLPKLPNSVESKINGVRFLMRWFNNK